MLIALTMRSEIASYCRLTPEAFGRLLRILVRSRANYHVLALRGISKKFDKAPRGSLVRLTFTCWLTAEGLDQSGDAPGCDRLESFALSQGAAGPERCET